MFSRLSCLLILFVTLGLILPAEAAAEFTRLPTGFTDEPVVGGVASPTAIAWLPASENGDLLIASQGGDLFRWDETNPVENILDLTDTICSVGETGLLGLAVDPNFAGGDRFIYLYYTDRQGGGPCNDPSNRANRVHKFEMTSDDEVIEEDILIDNIPARGGNHNGGDLQFDNDGLLYVSVGDSGEDLTTGENQDDNKNARRLNLLNGKILRITTDGSIPAGNPFQGQGSVRCADSGRAVAQGQSVEAAKKNRKNKKKRRKNKRERRQQRRNRGPSVKCQEIFATGLRNPYRIAFDPNDSSGAQRFFINDVGGNGFEEVNENTGESFTDYGWNLCEGPNRINSSNGCPSQFERPVFAYGHGKGGAGFSDCNVITGGAFAPSGGDWADYYFADFGCQRLFELEETPSISVSEFGSGTNATHMAFGPDGALYYTTFEGGGQVRKIVDGP